MYIYRHPGRYQPPNHTPFRAPQLVMGLVIFDSGRCDVYLSWIHRTERLPLLLLQLLLTAG
jgi:hypothetical protein